MKVRRSIGLTMGIPTSVQLSKLMLLVFTLKLYVVSRSTLASLMLRNLRRFFLYSKSSTKGTPSGGGVSPGAVKIILSKVINIGATKCGNW